MKKLFSHITAAMCALFVFACFAICANAAQAAFNVSFNSDMAVGKSQQISASKEGGNLGTLSYKSENSAVASVDSNGIITANKAGSAKINCTSQGGESVSFDISVKAMPSSISLSASEKSLNEGQTFDLNARVNSGAYPTSFVYSSADSSVASVSASGRVSAIKEGKTVITAESENGIKASCVVYVYSKNDIELNMRATKVAMDYSNVTKIVYGKSALGRNLEAFVINGGGNNSKTLFCTFAVHGFEDSYYRDGKLLVDAANDIVEYFAENPDNLWDYRLVIVPCANPDGTIDGENNYRAKSGAFGRCTADNVDMNRDFISGKFQACESRALRDLMYKYKMNVYIDFHGWLNSVLGDPDLVSIYRSTNNLSRDQSNHYGIDQGYIFGWAKANLGAKSALVEFRSPSSLNSNSIKDGIYETVRGSWHKNTGMQVKYSDSLPAPQNLTVYAKSGGTAHVDWNSVSGANGYQVWYKAQDGAWQTAPTVAGHTYCDVSGLVIGCEYTFTVRALYHDNSTNIRTYSNNYSSYVEYQMPLARVSGLSVAARADDGSFITLTWTPQLNAAGYYVYELRDNNWEKIATLGGGLTKYYNAVGTSSGGEYYFAVAAYTKDEASVGEKSATLHTAAACERVGSATASIQGNSKIKINWQSVNCSGYYVQWSKTSDFKSDCAGAFVLGKNSTEYTAAVGTNAKDYYVRVRAYKEVDSQKVFGPFCEGISAETGLHAMSGFVVTGRGNGGAALWLDWTGRGDADEYDVYDVTDGKNLLKGTVQTNQFVFTDLTPAWEYDIRVVAKQGGKAVACGTYRVCAATPVVQNFTATVTGENTLKAEWDYAVCHGYYIQWSTDPTFTDKSQTNGAWINSTFTTSFEISTDKPSGEYYVRIRSWKNYQGSKIFSDFCEGVSPSGLTEPRDFAVTGRGNGGTALWLDWADVKNAENYYIYDVTNGANELKGITQSSKFTFVDLNPAWEYDIKVVAKNGEDSSEATYRICAATAPVENFKASATGANTIKATWDYAVCHGYYIQWSTDKNFKSDVHGEWVNGTFTTSFEAKTDKPASEYYVRIRSWKYYQGGKIFSDFCEPIKAV